MLCINDFSEEQKSAVSLLDNPSTMKSSLLFEYNLLLSKIDFILYNKV